MDLYYALFKGKTLPQSCADLFFGVIMIIKTYIFLRFRILVDISVSLILAIIKIW